MIAPRNTNYWLRNNNKQIEKWREFGGEIAALLEMYNRVGWVWAWVETHKNIPSLFCDLRKHTRVLMIWSMVLSHLPFTHINSSSCNNWSRVLKQYVVIIITYLSRTKPFLWFYFYCYGREINTGFWDTWSGIVLITSCNGTVVCI